MLTSCAGKAYGAAASEHTSHGTAFVVVVGSAVQEDLAASPDRIREATAILRERLEIVGAPFVIEAGPDARLIITVGDLRADVLVRVREAVSRFGWIEFRLVHPQGPVVSGKSAPDGHEELVLESVLRDQFATERLWVKRVPEMMGDAIAKAGASPDQVGRAQVELQLTPAGEKRFGEVTRRIVRDAERDGRRGRLAIVVDGQLLTAPYVIEEISGGRASITGNFTEHEALELCNLLNNPIDFPIRLAEERKF